MKKYFITGLVILLPAALTFAVVVFIFNLLTTPFLGIVKSVLDHYDLLETNFLFLSADQLQTFISQLIIIIILFFFTVFLGLVGRQFFFYTLLRLWDYMIHRIPFINTIYKTSQDVIHTIFSSKATAFQRVAMVPFPNPQTRTIGLVTRDKFPNTDGMGDMDLVVVFVPTTPNPTSGFLTLFKREDVVFIDMKVEDAFKFIISCGVLMPSFNAAPQESVIKSSPNISADKISY